MDRVERERRMNKRKREWAKADSEPVNNKWILNWIMHICHCKTTKGLTKAFRCTCVCVCVYRQWPNTKSNWLSIGIWCEREKNRKEKTDEYESGKGHVEKYSHNSHTLKCLNNYYLRERQREGERGTIGEKGRKTEQKMLLCENICHFSLETMNTNENHSESVDLSYSNRVRKWTNTNPFRNGEH